jgi:WD40 repeat protein
MILGLTGKARAGEGAVGEIFISHASADGVLAARVAEGVRLAGHSIFLDSDREDGIAPGTAWQGTLFRELRICDAVVFLNSMAAQASMWCHSELVVAAELGRRVYSLDLGPGLPPHPLLRSLQGIGFDTTIDVGIRRLTDCLELDGVAGSGRLRWERGRPPYPGLAAMDVADAGVFFGREDEVRDLTARVDGPLGQRDGDLVIVMGPSGAGKSSLVRAGLVARLSMPRSGWAVAAPFEPGLRPLDRLADALAALIPGQLADSECRDRLTGEGLAAFGEWLVGHARTGARRLLLTVDQAEQLTTTPPTGRGDFLSMLSGGLGPGSPVTVVMTVRSDRFDEIQRLPAIGAAIRAPFVIAPLNRSRLTLVIEGPARRADLSFEPGLVSRLADDAARGGGETADALPLLAFVLREMYDQVVSEGHEVFTGTDYERAGLIDGAIARRAGAAEEALPPDSGPALDRMLTRFLVLDEERLPAARPVPRELLTATEQTIARKLEDQRLLAGTGDSVRLAHERLITAWPRLAEIVADRRDDLLMQVRLERQAADWADGHGALLGRDATTDAGSWLAREARTGTSHSAISEYVRTSQAALRRRRATIASVRAAIVALVLAVSAVAVLAYIQRSDAVSQSRLAQSETRTAQSEAMAAEATSLLPVDGPLAMLLSLRGYQTAPTLQARSAVIEAAQQPLDDLLVSGSAVDSVAFSPDGRALAAADIVGDIGLWDVATGRKTATLAQGSLVDSVAFSPDGRTLAAGDSSGDIGLWDVATGRKTATLAQGNPVGSLAFSPDGRTLAAGDSSGDIGLWDVATGRKTATLAQGNPIGSLAFSPDGRTLAVVDGDGHAGMWDMATGRKTATLAQGGLVDGMAFSPDGRTLAASDMVGDIGLWDMATGRKTATLAQGNPVGSLAFSPDGRTLAGGDSSGDIGLWDVVTAQAANITEGGSVGSVAFGPGGRTVAGIDVSGHVGLYDVATGRRTATLAEGNSVDSVAFSPGGRTLAAGDSSGHVGVWDVATGRKTATLAQGSLVDSVAFSPDGRTLAAGDDADHVGLWDVATGRRTATLAESTTLAGGGIDSVAFSPGGRTLAVVDGDGHAGLWDVATGRRTATLAKSTQVLSVAFSPDSPTLVTGDRLGNVNLWNTANGQRLASLPEAGGAVVSLTFSPSGQVLAIGSLNGNIALLRQNLTDLTQQFFTHLICGKVRGNMTRAQWAEYAPGQPYQQTCP